jgi:hypothetical protein
MRLTANQRFVLTRIANSGDPWWGARKPGRNGWDGRVISGRRATLGSLIGHGLIRLSDNWQSASLTEVGLAELRKGEKR